MVKAQDGPVRSWIIQKNGKWNLFLKLRDTQVTQQLGIAGFEALEIRRFSASQLAFVTADIEVFLDRLKVPLNDPDASVRLAAVEAVGLQTDCPDKAMPLLIKALDDPQESVSSHACAALGDFGT